MLPRKSRLTVRERRVGIAHAVSGCAALLIFAAIMGIIEQVSRYDDHVREMREVQKQQSQQQIAVACRRRAEAQ